MFSWESQHSVKVGGISPHVTPLAETLAKEGHEVHIFTRIGNRSEYDMINGVHYQRCRHDQSGGIVNQMDRMCEAMIDRFYAAEKLFGKFDVLHCHDWHPVLVMYNLKKTRSVPWVITFHSTEWGRNGNMHAGTWESREISHREWLGGYEAKEIITTSAQLKNELMWLYQFPDSKTALIPNGVFSVRKNVNAGTVKEKFGIHPLAPMILFIGRVTYQKGPDLLVEAIPHVLGHRWDAKFVIAGEGGMRMHCEYRARQLGVMDSCRFLGYISDDTFLDLINACDIFCVPSRNEPFGIVVLEAWSASKPVICTDAVDLIENFVDGIKAHFYPESIAWCINTVIDKPDALRWMGEQGRKKVEKKYVWDLIAKDTVGVYRKSISP